MDFINANYKVYLERMTNSFNVTSKGNIPKWCDPKGRTLDVGCGSGVLLETLPNAVGIDLNPSAVQACLNRGLNAKCVALEDIDETFDTIVFSSVLHEFSSYADENRFSDIPIMKALSAAHSKLNANGQIIIRDGIEEPKYRATLIAKNKAVREALFRYQDEAPMFKHTPIEIRVSGNVINAPSNFLKEFMFTYTWGPESYPREVNEKYGILTVDNWIRCVKSANFEVQYLKTYEEEYVKYLSECFEVTADLKKIFKNSTIFIVATKK